MNDESCDFPKWFSKWNKIFRKEGLNLCRKYDFDKSLHGFAELSNYYIGVGRYKVAEFQPFEELGFIVSDKDYYDKVCSAAVNILTSPEYR